MKKTLILPIIIILFSLISCSEKRAMNPAGGSEEVFIQVDSVLFKVHWITVTEDGSGFYMLTQPNATIKVTNIP